MCCSANRCIFRINSDNGSTAGNQEKRKRFAVNPKVLTLISNLSENDWPAGQLRSAGRGRLHSFFILLRIKCFMIMIDFVVPWKLSTCKDFLKRRRSEWPGNELQDLLSSTNTFDSESLPLNVCAGLMLNTSHEQRVQRDAFQEGCVQIKGSFDTTGVLCVWFDQFTAGSVTEL